MTVDRQSLLLVDHHRFRWSAMPPADPELYRRSVGFGWWTVHVAKADLAPKLARLARRIDEALAIVKGRVGGGQ